MQANHDTERLIPSAGIQTRLRPLYEGLEEVEGALDLVLAVLVATAARTGAALTDLALGVGTAGARRVTVGRVMAGVSPVGWTAAGAVPRSSVVRRGAWAYDPSPELASRSGAIAWVGTERSARGTTTTAGAAAID
ncbi:MAG: hypothetical protein H0V74_01345 [Chloroflexi bacterium]|nr:hypothetical protein [Chloroflexota bacterium]